MYAGTLGGLFPRVPCDAFLRLTEETGNSPPQCRRVTEETVNHIKKDSVAYDTVSLETAMQFHTLTM